MEVPDRYRIQREIKRETLSQCFVGTDADGALFKIRRILLDRVEPGERGQLRDAVRRLASRLPALKGPSFEHFAGLEEGGDGLDLVWNWAESQDYLPAPLPRDTADSIADLKEIAAALDQAHRLGIVHGALRPAVISRNGDHVIVSEFLVERTVYRYAIQEEPLAEGRYYESPEQIQETGESGASDQFSLAAVAYLWLTGRKPFEAENVSTLQYRICKEQPPSPRLLNDKLSEATAEAILKGLAKRPEDRFRNCSDFVAAMERAETSAAVPVAAVATEKVESDRGSFAATAAAATTPIEPRLPPESMVTPGASAGPSPVGPGQPKFATRSPEAATRRRQTTEIRKNSAGWWLRLAFFAGLLTAGGIWLWRTWTPVPQPLAPATDARDVNSIPPPPESELNPPDGEMVGKSNPSPPNGQRQTVSKPDPRQFRNGGTQQVRRAPTATRNEASQAAATGGRIAPKFPPANPPKAAEPSVADVHIVTIPSGAQVSFDGGGAPGCEAPCSRQLSAGRHTLSASAPGFGAEKRILNVPGDREIVINLRQDVGTLLVASDPPGALVLVDGTEAGRTPASLRLSVGQHRLSIVNGSLRAEDTVHVSRDQLTSRTYRW